MKSKINYITLWLLSFLCLQNVHAQYPLLTQDSVYTHIENGKAVTTFKVTASSSGNYSLRFWLMGVKHTDATYSSYAMRIDNNAISDYVTTDRGDWHLYQPDNTPSTYLTQGQHEIHLEGTLSDVPNAERVMTPEITSFMNANTRYAKMKNHENYANYSVFNADSLETYHRVINYNRLEDDITKGPFQFNAELNKKVYYTFFRLEYYTQGQTVSITTDEVNGVGHVLNVFSKSSSYNTTWADSTYNGHANLTITIPRTDFYYVMVRTQTPADYGTCNLTINNDKRFEGVPISNSHTPLQHIHYGPIYSCFAKSSVGDPVIFLVRSDGKVIDFNDDYPYSTSNYNWQRNARIDGLLFTNFWLQTTAKSYPPETIQRFDIHVGCKIDNFGDDELISSDVSDVLNWNFNCIAWSVGEWTTWIDPYDNILQFDSLYALNGFERTTDAGQAKIDLWRDPSTLEFTHASVKAKATPYAAGYDWESKKGGLERVFHPRYSLTGYGQVSHHYKKTYNSIIPLTLMSFSFSQQETAQIEYGAEKVSGAVKDRFQTLLGECYEDRNLMQCGSTREFQLFASYRRLLEFCREDKGADFLLYREIAGRKVIPVRILHDITEARAPQVLEEVEKQCERLSRDGGIRAVRNVQADGVLLVKMLLSGKSGSDSMAALASEGVTYSSDNLLNVSVAGGKLDIDFALDFDAVATVIVAPAGGLGMEKVADGRDFAAGRNHLYCSVPQPGIYTVSLMVNGALYEKKVCVK